MKLKKVENFVDNAIYVILILLPWLLIDLPIAMVIVFNELTLTINYILIFIGLFLGSTTSIITGFILLKKKSKNLEKTLLISNEEGKKND